MTRSLWAVITCAEGAESKERSVMKVQQLRKIKKNSLKCLLCGDIITSKHVHDFVRCSCKNVFTDGGNEYLRRGITELLPNGDEPFVDLSEFE